MNNVVYKRGIDTKEEIEDLLLLLKDPVSLTFNTNVLRIALNQHEEKIASLLAQDYVIKIDEEMMLRAVKTGQVDFLYYIFYFNKNFMDITSTHGLNKNEISADGKFRVFTIDFVIRKLIDYSDEQVAPKIRQIGMWKIKSTENILKSFLSNNMDVVANEFSLFYIDNADKDLMIYALDNYNELFLKYAFRNGIFSQNLLTQDDTIELLLTVLKDGVKIELLLNVLLFCDFSRWQ